jgi:hypothetical protein
LAIAPEVTEWYGSQFKGIEPNRFTVIYLDNVNELDHLVEPTDLFAPPTEAALRDLRTMSVDLIDEAPFQVANKLGTLERIKARMRRHVEETTRVSYKSSKQAFATFWSSRYLSQMGYQSEMAFFDNDIRPLIKTNYFRGLGFDARPVNYFIKIDGVFIALFGIELSLRILMLCRRYRGLSLLDAILWRWYDLLLIFPFSLVAPGWALSRIIPATVRINQSKLLKLEPLRHRISRLLIAGVAVELTEIVLVRIINQLQTSIRNGDSSKLLLRDRHEKSQYTNLGGVNEINEIAHQISSTIIYDTLPTVRPNIEELLTYTVVKALARAPVYAQLGHLPGFTAFSQQMVQELVDNLYETLYEILTRRSPDLEREKLVNELKQQFSQTFKFDLQKNNSVEKIEALALVWLEELKINYIRQVATEDEEILQEKSRELYEITRVTPKS